MKFVGMLAVRKDLNVTYHSVRVSSLHGVFNKGRNVSLYTFELLHINVCTDITA